MTRPWKCEHLKRTLLNAICLPLFPLASVFCNTHFPVSPGISLVSNAVMGIQKGKICFHFFFDEHVLSALIKGPLR